MAARNDTEKEVDYADRKNWWNETNLGIPRSLSYSGRNFDESFQASRARSFSGQSHQEFHEFSSQNKQRTAAFDTLCQHLGELHNEPLSLRDWEQFKEWFEQRPELSSTFSPKEIQVYTQCKMVMIDIYGKLPTDETWENAKEWFSARHQNSSREMAVKDMGADKFGVGETPMDTTEQRRKFSEQPHDSEYPTKLEDPKSQTRREVDSLKQKQVNTESELDHLKRKVETLEENVETLRRENLELSRQRTSPTTRTRNIAPDEQADADSFMSQKRELQIELERYHMKLEQLDHEIVNRDQEIRELKSAVMQLSYRLEEKSDQVNRLENDVYSKNKQIQRLEKDKADALRRLSTLASAKLSDNNPEITDLSDMNRPQKIAEKYSELYDNEWTDVYEYLTTNGKDHKKAVAILLHVLENCFQFCKTVGKQQYEVLLNMACSPSQNQKDAGAGIGIVPVQTERQVISQKVIELRKTAFQHSLNTIRQSYQTDRLRDEVHSTTQDMSLYVDKCLEVSWLACIQDPPLEIFSDFPLYSKVDLNIARIYTKSGEYVEYVIWPALLLSNDGALLSKAVVQCTSKSR
ncbi:uncharacterized protein LOC132558343 [Ylistrum balloti]|uniref:uncharacterized protein LOC132558343 n=1 Tax=Ylistrum balloti TaxID=509963 RepID=UPI00290590B9|nr:uncharacterized protein LOC132558343 [Ylistrum balloti]